MISLKRLFSITFGITILARAMTWHVSKGVIPYTEIYVLFIATWTLLAIRERKVQIPLRSNGTKVIVLLTLYYIIWGVSNLGDIDFNDTIAVMFRSLLMMAFVIVSCYWMRKLDCMLSAIKAAYISLTILLWILFIAYFNQINLIRTISSFWISEEWLRTRTRFGFNNNIAAEYAMSVILMSLYILAEDKKREKRSGIKHLLMWLNNLIMVIIIIANNSRGTALALMMMIVVFLLIKSARRYGVRKLIHTAVACVCVVVLLLVLGIIQGRIDVNKLLENTNRSHFLNNIEVLRSSGRWLMGIGNISGEYFSKHHVLYGIQLDYMEMAYVGFFVTSGIVGCLWLVYIVYLLIKSIVKYIEIEDEVLGKWILLIFAYMMFLSLFEGYIFSYTYITSSVFLCFVIAFINSSYMKSKYNVVKGKGR